MTTCSFFLLNYDPARSPTCHSRSNLQLHKHTHTKKNSPQIVGRVADDARNVCSNSVQKITEGQQRFSFNILVIHTP